MIKKIKDTTLPDVWSCENTIFNICMNNIDEFPQYITKLDDIDKRFPEKYLSSAYKNLEMDFVRMRDNGNLVNIEHHSSITPHLMRRDFTYLTTLHVASGSLIEPYIFNTGNIPNFTVEYASETSIYNPIWINTQEIEASVKLNNIKYKISKQEPLNVFDVCDLIWMPKFRSNEETEDIIVELAIISNKLLIEEKLYHIFRRCLILWAGKIVETEEKITKIKEELNMSPMETEELYKKTLQNARIEGQLYRAYEDGMKEGKKMALKEKNEIYLEEGKKQGLERGLELGLEEGIEKGIEKGSINTERKFIEKLLKKHTPEEISKEYDVPLERILQIQNDTIS